jgi:methylase of polypeptide subunit release factors
MVAPPQTPTSPSVAIDARLRGSRQQQPARGIRRGWRPDTRGEHAREAPWPQAAVTIADVRTAATGTQARPPVLDDGDVIHRLRAALDHAGFTIERLEDALGTHELSARHVDTVVHARRLDGDDAFTTLARLFVVGVRVARIAAAEAVAPLPLEALERLGLVRGEGDDMRPLVRLVPHGDYYVCSDLHHEIALEMPSDYVPGIQAPSVTLAKLAVRRDAGAALDLGTGCGIQALLAARHCKRVVATDVNSRALGYAAFNARLNGVDDVDFRLGAAFEPVEGDRFDLVVSNPPYVISPDASYAYRDSGMAVDDLCRGIVEGVPRFLAGGGFAHVLVSWAHERGRWAEPLRGWVSGRGCDAWLLHFGSQDPLSHSAQWLAPLGEADPAAYENALDRWLVYLRENGIDAIGYGAVILRRREGASDQWIHEDDVDLERVEAAGEHTLRVFAAQDFLRGLADDRELLVRRLALAPEQRLEQTLAWEDAGAAVESQALTFVGGFGFRVGIDRYTAALLPHFDGTATLEAVLARAAAQVELAAGDRERFVPAALPVVRRLVALGFLVPADA